MIDAMTPKTLDSLDLTAEASLCAVFQATAARHPDRTALRTLGDSTHLTWGQYAQRVEEIARGLAALGIGRGDTVALMMANRPEFHLVDTAALHLGATCLSIYNTLPGEDVAWTLEDAGATVLFCETALLATALAARDPRQIETVVLVDGEHPEALSLDGLVAGGSPDFDLEAAWRAVDQSDVAVVIYTSGTTGRPKGVELTHGSVLGNVQGLHSAIGTIDGARVISYLPMAHIAERQLSHYRAMAAGLEVTTCPDPRVVASHLTEVRPHYFFAPPRMLDKFRSAVLAQPEQLENADHVAILEHFGLDQVQVALTGSAPVPPELSQFWIDLGLPLVEAWGITECGAFGAFGRPDDYQVGTCGKALPGVELRLADDGEILLRSPWLMRGYRGRPEKSAEAIDPGGWLHTGDVGELDDDGNLRIIDRKKEIIINAAGKNMSPAHIESRLKDSHPLIGEACVIGNDRPYNVALVLLDPDAAAATATKLELADMPVSDLAQDDRVQAAVEKGVAAANERLARVEQIKRFKLVPDQWLPGGDELTPTMKLKRKPIEEKYAESIEALYAGAAGSEAP